MRIVVIVYDRISPFMLSTPLAVFAEPFLSTRHEVRLCAAEPGSLSGIAGLGLSVPFGLEGLEGADLVIVPGWRDVDEPAPPELAAALALAQRAGAVIVGLCLGAFVLADAGLLSGRRATTHWARAGAFRERYPEVTLDEAAIYIDEGNVVTSAGIAAGLDCCLHLLARFEGVACANAVARHLVVAPHRAGGQAQFIDRPIPPRPADRRMAALIDWMSAHLDQPMTIDALASRMSMSRRSFTRHFRAQTGGTVGDWLRAARVQRAREMLEDGGHSIEAIATATGFGAASSLRDAFRAETGVSPRQWRTSFSSGN